MATVEYKGKSFEVDEDGFLQKFEDWTLEWVDYVKDSEGIKELTPEHNKVIEFLQDYYKKNPIRYAYYRKGCGRDARIIEVWGSK